MKRPNPSTGLPFVVGDVREDGRRFLRYQRDLRENGTFTEHWTAPETYFRVRVAWALNNAARRAKECCVPFDIDTDYLLSIFPQDALCPILSTPMVFGGERRNSPSLDRRTPALGYVRGNLCWISNQANLIKQDITDPAVFRAIAEYVGACTTQHTSILNNV